MLGGMLWPAMEGHRNRTSSPCWEGCCGLRWRATGIGLALRVGRDAVAYDGGPQG